MIWGHIRGMNSLLKDLLDHSLLLGRWVQAGHWLPMDRLAQVDHLRPAVRLVQVVHLLLPDRSVQVGRWLPGHHLLRGGH